MLKKLMIITLFLYSYSIIFSNEDINPYKCNDVDYNVNQVDFSIEFKNYLLKDNKVNLKAKYAKKDLSKHIFSFDDIKSNQFKENILIGVIGSNYQCIFFKIDTIYKISNFKYKVKGKTKLRNNISNFNGEIEILNVAKLKKDKINNCFYDYSESNVHQAIYKYIFLEEKQNDHSCKYEGNGTFIFIDDNKNQVYSNVDISEYCDEISIVCVGFCKSSSKEKSDKCIFGTYIGSFPFCTDFCCSDGDPIINPKYLKNDWEWYGDIEKYIEIDGILYLKEKVFK